MPSILRVPRWCVFLVLLLLAATGFAHLSADFPNYSRWTDDAARFTDEGWWAGGAIRHILTGGWVAAHDYNPVVAVPLWPALLSVVFRFTGISAVAARATAFCFTIGTVLACGRLMGKKDPAMGWAAMTLIASSPILFFFSRLSILEAALLFFLVTTALAANSERPPAVPRLVLCGVLYTLAMLTKTSALFVAPAIFFLLWFPHRRLWSRGGEERRRLLFAVIVPAATFILCYGFYWALVIRTHPEEMRVFYSGAGPTLRLGSARKAVRIVYRCFTWVDAIVFPAAIMALSALRRRLRIVGQDPLFGFAALFFVGYSAFMVARFDAGPHYFAVLTVPLTILALLLLQALRPTMPRAFAAMGAVLLLAALLNLGYIAKLSMHPQYTMRDACRAIKDRIASDPSVSPLVIGHGAIQTSLFTGLPALDDLGEEPLDQKLRTEHPGWVVTWNNEARAFLNPDVQRDFAFKEVGRYRVFDNSVRNSILLYRIQPR